MRKTVAIFTVSALLLGLAAAGGAAEPIKIGAFFALSGPATNIGAPTKLVAQMVVDKINKEGGINGRQIELVMGDTESDPTKAAAVAKKFIFQDKVAAIIGPSQTSEGMAVKKIAEEAGVPTVMTVGGDPVVMGGEKLGPYTFIFKSPQRSATAVKKLYGYLKGKGLTRVALVTSSDGFGKDGATWLKSIAPEFGITFVAEESFGPSDTDMTAQLTKVRNAGPQAIVCWTISPGGAILAKNMAQMAISLPLFQCHGLPDPNYVLLAGKASEGNRMPATKLMVWEQIADSDPQKPVIKEFVRLYNDVYKHDKDFPINTHSGYAWDAIMLVANAMKKAGTDPKALRDAIQTTKGYVGVSGIYNLTADDHVGLDLDSMVMVEVKGGKFVLAP